jgi:hypothetical protein
VLASALAAAGSFLLEPAPGEPEAAQPPCAADHPVVAVFGLARGCGTTVVARALAAELARRSPGGVAAVHSPARGAGIPLATQAATGLARTLADLPGAETRPLGRLALVGGAAEHAIVECARPLAPLVLDAGSDAVGGVSAALADIALLVATPALEPALAAASSDCLERVGARPLVVLNRAQPPDPGDPKAGWEGRAHVLLPESRVAAQLALGGREPRGELGRAVAELADLCGADG